MPINVILLILSLCGPGNTTSCRRDMTECYKRKHAEELRYGAAVDSRVGCVFQDVGFPCKPKPYPETALVYECAIDLGIYFTLPVKNEEVEDDDLTPALAN